MRFSRQTLLFVCLILPCVVFGQPVAGDDAVSVLEDLTLVSFNILINDSDPTFGLDVASVDLDPSTPGVNDASIVTAEGTFSVDPTGLLTFVPTPNYFGPAVITYTVANTEATPQVSAPATITVTVTPANDAPTIGVISNLTVGEDSGPSADLPFTVGDIETAAGSLTLSGSSGNTAVVSNANIFLGGSGANRTVSVTPTANAVGTAVITVTVLDPDGGTAATPFNVVVTAVNDPPVITAIGPQTIAEDGTLSALPVTVSDIDSPVGSLTLTGTSSNNALVLDANVTTGGSGANRTVTAVPQPDQNGATTIELTLSDGSLTDVTSFQLNVTAIEDLPTITAIGPQTTTEGVAINGIPFTITDAETPAASLTLTATSSLPALIPVANITFGGSGSSRNVSVDPLPNQSGTTTITVTVRDAANNTAPSAFQVQVTAVDNPPTITSIADQITNEDVASAVVPFMIGDSDTPLASVTVTASSDNQTLIPDGNISLTGSGANRNVQVTPFANRSGVANITVTVDDGTTEVAEAFMVTVNAVNDPPTITAIATQNIDEDEVGGTGAVNFTIGDVDDAIGTLIVTAAASNTTLFPSVTLGGSGTARTVQAIPAADQNGSSTITISVNDGTVITTRVFTVNVAAVNDLPTITPVANQVIAENGTTGALDFTIGDVDTPLGSLTVTRVSSNTTIVPTANVVLGGSGTDRTVTVTPALGQSGTVTITLRVSDGTIVQTAFLLTINSVDDAPTITAIADQVINEDNATAAIPFTIGDPDTPIGSLTLSATSSDITVVPVTNIVFGGSGTSRTVTVTPDPDQNGSSNIVITVHDATGSASEPFTLTVNPVNDAPTLAAISNKTTNEDVPTGDISFVIGDKETSPAALVVTATSGNTTLVPNANITLAGTGPNRTIDIAPVADLSGSAVITVNVFDGTATTTRTFTLTVTPVNDPPTFTLVVGNQTVIEDNSTGPLNFTIADSETPVGSLTVTRSSTNTTIVPVANVVLGGSGANRTVTVTPAANQSGVSTIRITVDDGTATTFFEFDVTITGVNDSPTLSSISNRTINEDTPTGNIGFTISDPETAATLLTVTGSSSNQTLVQDGSILLGGTTGSRTVNVTPEPNQSGSTIITLQVSDGVNTATRTFTVTVTAVNDVPVIAGQIPISVNEVQPVVLSLSQLTIVDPDNNIPADFTLLVSGGANYTITGLTTITPFPNFSGVLSVPVFVSDGTAYSAIFYLQISVNSTNDAPQITGQQALGTNEDQAIMLQLSNFTVVDPDNVAADMTFSVLDGTNYTRVGNTVTPALNYSGALTVRVKVNDGTIDSAPYNAQVTVTAVNDPPVITAQSALSTGEEVPITLVIGNFTVTDPEPTSYTLTVSQTAGPNYTVSGNMVTPALNFNGVLSVPVTASDGSANSAAYDAQITVTAINDAPVITGQVSLSTVEDVPITLELADLTVTDVDNTYPTGFTLTVVAGANYGYSGRVVTPALDFNGTLFVNVRVNDGSANSATYAVQVLVTDDADVPVITGQNAVGFSEDTSREILLTDLVWEDPDTPTGQIVLSVLPGSNYLSTGNTVTPAPNFFGTLTVNVRLYDGEANSNTYALQVTIMPVNDNPTFNAIAPVTILEDAAQQTVTITGISAGPLETQQLVLSVVSDNTALIPHPVQTPQYNGTAASAIISFKPQANMFGTATITVKILDADLGEATKTFTITVTSVNDAPTLAAITVDPIIEDSPEQIIPLTGISTGGGASESAQNLSVILSAENGELLEVFAYVYTPNQTTGSLRVKPKPNAFGTVKIKVRIQDTGLDTSPNVNFVERVFDLVIQPVNDPPVFVTNGAVIAEPGKPYEYAIEVVDVDGDAITLTAPSLPPWLTFTVGTNGKAVLSGTPPANASGAANVVIQATDPTGPPLTQPYVITVNSRPTLTPITINIIEEEVHRFTELEFAGGFHDADGNTIAELQILDLPSKGVLRKQDNSAVVAGDKFMAADLDNITYTPMPDASGIDSLHWNARDGFDAYSLLPSAVIIKIAPVNDPPVITDLETDTLKYELGSEEPIFLTSEFDGYDPDDDDLTGAEIGFQRIDNYRYRPESDRLVFQSNAKITGNFDVNAGILTLTGKATAKEYVTAIRSVKYNYVDALDLVLDNRSVYIALSDGQSTSLQRARLITLIYTFKDLKIPSAFTPQGDEVNETWTISSAGNNTNQLYNDAEIKIYNKKGLLLYEAKGLQKPWNGIWNGELLPSGTYFYTIDLNYNKVKYKGTVTILR